MIAEEVRYEFVATGNCVVRVADNQSPAFLSEGDQLTISRWRSDMLGLLRPVITVRPAPTNDYTKGGTDGSI